MNIENFADASEETAVKAEELLRKEVERRKTQNPVAWFPWHEIQSWVFGAPGMVDNPVRVIFIAGGNRSGKSKLAMGIISSLIRRESPLNKQLTTTDNVTGEIRVKDDSDPLNLWVIPPTKEKSRLDWMAPSDQMGLRYWTGDRFLHYTKQPDNVVYVRTPGLNPYDSDGNIREDRVDKIILKSQDQRLETFESSEVDAAFFDEEVQSRQKWNSVLMRIATNNGFICMTFTPLHGLTWSHKDYWKPFVKNGRAERVAKHRWYYEPEDREQGAYVFVQMPTHLNPRAKAYAKERWKDPSMSQAEKEARLLGQYGYVEGALIKNLAGMDLTAPDEEHKPYIVDVLPGERDSSFGGGKAPGYIKHWYTVADPNKSYGALLGGVDQDGNLFIVAEHLQESWPTRLHARAIRKMEKRYARGHVTRYADPGSAGAQNIVDLADYGLMFSPVERGQGSVSASIKRVRELSWKDPMHHHPITGERGAPRIYFYRPGLVKKYKQDGVIMRTSKVVEQLSKARQTDNQSAPPDTPHKDIRSKLDLFDCLRYMAYMAAQVQDDTEENSHRKRPQGRLPTDSDMAKMKLNPEPDSGILQHWTEGNFGPTYDFG